MTQTNVTKFADELGLLPTVLLAQLKAAGVEKQLITDNLTKIKPSYSIICVKLMVLKRIQGKLPSSVDKLLKLGNPTALENLVPFR